MRWKESKNLKIMSKSKKKFTEDEKNTKLLSFFQKCVLYTLFFNIGALYYTFISSRQMINPKITQKN